LAYIAATCGAALADPTVQAAPAIPKSTVAPADMYFGRLKMSVLGIQNVIKDMRIRVEVDASRTPSIFGALAMVEDAMRDWESQYPHDSWIAKDLLALETTYLTAPGDQAHLAAVKVEAWLRRDYAKSQYALRGHEELAKATLAAAAAAQAAAVATPAPAANVQATVDTAPGTTH
jgi:hypothetical protein